MFAHLGFVVAFAKRQLLISFLASRDLIEVDVHAETGFVRYPHATAGKLYAAANYHFVFFRLPRVVGVTCVPNVGRCRSGVSHSHQADAEMII